MAQGRLRRGIGCRLAQRKAEFNRFSAIGQSWHVVYAPAQDLIYRVQPTSAIARRIRNGKDRFKIRRQGVEGGQFGQPARARATIFKLDIFFSIADDHLQGERFVVFQQVGKADPVGIVSRHAGQPKSGLPDQIAFEHDRAPLHGDGFSAERQQGIAAFPRLKQVCCASYDIVDGFDRRRVEDLEIDQRV